MQEKRKYKKPAIRNLLIDDRITLVMTSTRPPPPSAPPGGGTDNPPKSDRPFHDGPFDNNSE